MTTWTSAAVAAVLVIAGMIGWGVYTNQGANAASKLVTPSVAVDNGTGFAVGDGPVTIDLYEDFMCPICHEFETADGPTINQLIANREVTVRYHPVAILDDLSNGAQYSTRAAGAAAAAEGGKFKQYHDALYENQPEEESDGLTDAQLIQLGKSIGLGNTFDQAVADTPQQPAAAGLAVDQLGRPAIPVLGTGHRGVMGGRGGYRFPHASDGRQRRRRRRPDQRRPVHHPTASFHRRGSATLGFWS